MERPVCSCVLLLGDLEPIVRDLETLSIAASEKSKPKWFGKDSNFIPGVLETLFNLIDNLDDLESGALSESNMAVQDRGCRGEQVHQQIIF